MRYPREELLAVIAAEASRTATTIIGENLGTVPDEVSEALARWHVVGLYEEQFSARTTPMSCPRSPPAASPASAPTTCRRSPPRSTVRPPASSHEYRRLVADSVGHPVGDDPADVLDAALERLAASDAYATVIDVDDLIGEIAPHNVPGRILPSSWRRRLPRPASVVLGDLDVRRRVKLLSATREGSP